MPRNLASVIAFLCFSGLVGVVAASPASALTLQAQGRLSANGGGAVADGVYPVKFKLYASKDAPQPLWDETWIGLPVNGGMFAAELGTQDPVKNPLNPALFAANADLWLAVQVSIEPELPRVHLSPTAFAVRAQYADQLVGPLSGDQLVPGSVSDNAVSFNYAASYVKGGPALDLSCTGCVGVGELAPEVLTATNITWQKSNVGASLDQAWALLSQLSDAWKVAQNALQVAPGGIGVGKVPAGQCSLDLASQPNGLCIDGQPATVVLQASSEAAMAALAKPGQLVLRTDTGALYLYVGGLWKKLQFTAVCGDQSVDPPETCDDGNADNTDACAACQKAVCGDGFVRTGVEECDDGNADNTDGCAACKKAACGDGYVQAGVETCDGAQLGTATCVSQLGAGTTGTLACAADCKSFDTSKCVGPLGSQTNPAASCKAILTALPGSASGAYWLKSGVDKFKVYCDMTTGGGGWTLAVSWNYSTVPQQWGSFVQAVADPKPGVKYHTPFVNLFAPPAEFRMVYANGQVVSGTTAGQWEKSASLGVRIKLTSGQYLIFDHQSCAGGVDTATGFGQCVANGSYSDGFSCDGNSGQVSGSGMFNACAADENGCNGPAWSLNGSVQVCGAKDLVAVYFR